MDTEEKAKRKDNQRELIRTLLQLLLLVGDETVLSTPVWATHMDATLSLRPWSKSLATGKNIYIHTLYVHAQADYGGESVHYGFLWNPRPITVPFLQANMLACHHS